MTEKNFKRHRRTFISTSLKALISVMAATTLPRDLMGAQTLRAALMSPSRLPKGFNMLAARPFDLGSEIFAGVPKPLRASALQLQTLMDGLKPACRLSLTVEELQESTPYLSALGCKFVVEQIPPSETLYAQTSPRQRRLLIAMPRVRVYLAKSATDARRVAKLESGVLDYYALGLALGYPVCCVEAAAKRDHPYVDEKHGVHRQTNLTAATVRASSSADFRCNQFLAESELFTAGPVSGIAHYPCKLDCRETAAMSQAALECAARVWPVWTVTLCELLRAPVLYWSDDTWPPDYWNEYAGLALIEAHKSAGGAWESLLPALILGSKLTPAGSLPRSVVSVKAIKDHILLRDAAGQTAIHSVEQCGRPWIIDWRSGRVEKFG